MTAGRLFLSLHACCFLSVTASGPVAMITHYTDDACATLVTDSRFRGYYRNPAAKAGTAEEHFTYFCDPVGVARKAYAEFGIVHLESCYVDNGGNWYYQPQGLCAAFQNEDGPFYVKFWTIDLDARTTAHQQYSDAMCTVPVSTNKTVANNRCYPSTVPGMKSYQIVVPDALAAVDAADHAHAQISGSSSGGSQACYKQLPVAMITHYTDDACATLVTDSRFRGYYRNPAAKAGTAEEHFTYFCDPVGVARKAYAEFGIVHLESCYVDNGGNWYYQPQGLCAAFQNEDGPFYVKFWTIDLDARTTAHQQYSDAMCTVPVSTNKTVANNRCYPSTVPGMKSYQIVVPDVWNVVYSCEV